MAEHHGIAVQRASKVYGTGANRVDALRGVSLTFGRGEFVAVTGPSGCGKSTLLHLLAGLDTPTTGTVLIRGTDLGRLSEEDRTAFRGRFVGVVFQSFNLIDILTAEENVALPLILAGASDANAKRRAREVLERVGLGPRARHRPAEMSGGEQQRVAVARALVSDPPLIVADEPTGNLDTKNGRVVFDLLRGVVGEKRTVVVVTHDPALAGRADRAVRLEDGLVVSA